MVDDDPARRSHRGCLITLGVVTALTVAGCVGGKLYVHLGTASTGERAEHDLTLVGAALDRVPLFPYSQHDTSSTALDFVDRNPNDRQDAELAVRAARLGDFQLLYCGDVCPSWSPGEAVTEFRAWGLRYRQSADDVCAAEAEALEAGGVEIRPTRLGSAFGTLCSFSGCIGDVAVRMDLRGDPDEPGVVDSVDLFGAIGDASRFADPMPDCGERLSD